MAGTHKRECNICVALDAFQGRKAAAKELAKKTLLGDN
jgi:hypothetical protein